MRKKFCFRDKSIFHGGQARVWHYPGHPEAVSPSDRPRSEDQGPEGEAGESKDRLCTAVPGRGPRIRE